MVLLPLSRDIKSSDDADGGDDDARDGDRDGASGDGGDRGVEEVGDVVDGLERRALRLEHHMTAKECVGVDMAERLLPFFSSRYVCYRSCLFLHSVGRHSLFDPRRRGKNVLNLS